MAGGMIQPSSQWWAITEQQSQRAATDSSCHELEASGKLVALSRALGRGACWLWSMDIILPNQWQPRSYQRRLWNYLEEGGKRAVAVWHRRAGKDEVCLHWTACAAMQRVGNYWHMLPEASQALSTGIQTSTFALSSTSSAVETGRASHQVA